MMSSTGRPTLRPLVRILGSFAVFVVLSCSSCSSNVQLGDPSPQERKHHRSLDAATSATLKSLSDARASALIALNLIHQRYEFSSPRVQFLLVSTNLPTAAWDIVKYKTAKKFADGNSSFVFIFGGSSVTAGHDNFYNQSYPFVFERRVAGVFRSLGIDLQIRNIAHGTNKCRPSDLCYEAMGGYNADWIGWEQSFDCGRDRGIMELMARVAYWNRAVIFYSASGGFSPGHCPPSNDSMPWISEQWDPSMEPSLRDQVYAPNASDVTAFRTRLNAFYLDGNSVERFTAGLTERYKGTAPHGFSVWAGSKKECQNDIKGGVGCGALEIMGDCQGRKNGNHWMTKEASTFGAGHGAGHHPPTGIHLQRGEFIAYNYLHILLDAISLLEEDLKTKTSAAMSTAYQAELDTLQPQTLPDPEACQPECKTRSVCYTSFLPNFNPSHMLDAVIVGNTDEKESNWKSFHRTQHDERMGLKDINVLYETAVANATLHLKVAVSNQSDFLRVCGYGAKESMKNVLYFLDPNISSPDSHYVPSTQVVPWTQRKYYGDECTLLSGLPVGSHVLSLVCFPAGRLCSFSHLVLYE